MKLHDGDPDDVGPAAAISTKELALHRNDVQLIEGCVDALEGSTATAYWAFDEDQANGVEWFEYATDLPIAGNSLAFEYAPPPETIGKLSMLRVDVRDPLGRSYTSYMADRIVVIDADGPNGCGGEGSFVGGSACGESGESSGGSSETSAALPTSGGGQTDGDSTVAGDVDTTAATPASPSPTTPGGCGCGTGAQSSSVIAFALSMICMRPRRRRSR